MYTSIWGSVESTLIGILCLIADLHIELGVAQAFSELEDGRAGVKTVCGGDGGDIEEQMLFDTDATHIHTHTHARAHTRSVLFCIFAYYHHNHHAKKQLTKNKH